MLSRDSEYEMWSRFVFELVIWPQQVTLARRTQPSGTLCLWQCSYLCTNLSVLFFWCKITFMVSYCCVFLYWCQIFKFQIGRVSIYHAIIGLTEVVHIWEFPPHHVVLLRSPVNWYIFHMSSRPLQMHLSGKKLWSGIKRFNWLQPPQLPNGNPMWWLRSVLTSATDAAAFSLKSYSQIHINGNICKEGFGVR